VQRKKLKDKITETIELAEHRDRAKKLDDADVHGDVNHFEED
jgi:hypothetical protein